MEWNVLQPRITQTSLIGLYRLYHIVFVVMQYDRDQVQTFR